MIIWPVPFQIATHQTDRTNHMEKIADQTTVSMATQRILLSRKHGLYAGKYRTVGLSCAIVINATIFAEHRILIYKDMQDMLIRQIVVFITYDLKYKNINENIITIRIFLQFIS